MAGRVMVVALVVAMTERGVSGQGTLNCVGDLTVCQAAILNISVAPSKNCCSSLKNAVKNDLPCLCQIYSTGTIFQSLQLNKTRALELPKVCGIKEDLSQCNNVSAASPASTSAPSSEATPSSPGPSSGSSNGAVKLAWGMKPWWALGFLCASLIAL